MNETYSTLDIYQAAFLMCRGFELEGADLWLGKNYRFTFSGEGVKEAAGEYARDGAAPVQSLRNHLATLKKIIHSGQTVRGGRA
jgi:hypothetical protein